MSYYVKIDRHRILVKFLSNILNPFSNHYIYKSFSDKIICVLTEDNIESITQKDIDNYLVNFNLKDDLRYVPQINHN